MEFKHRRASGDQLGDCGQPHGDECRRYGHGFRPANQLDPVLSGANSVAQFKVERGRQYFINPGSVGQSRDGNPKAAYAIYDLEGRTIESRRVAFEAPPGKLGSVPAPRTPNPI